MARLTKQKASPIRVQLTLSGYCVLLGALLAGMAAGKTQAPLTFVLFGAIMAALVISAVLAWRMISPVDLSRELPDRVWQDQPTSFGYLLRGRRRRVCLGLRVKELSTSAELAEAYCLHLEPLATFRAGCRFAARKRGRLALGEIRLSTVFPFGLIRASRTFRQPAELVAWPARGCLRRQILHKGAAESSTARPSPVQGGQDEFFGLRDYRSGDNPRWIHWRRSASLGRPVVREMTQPLPDVLWLIVEAGAADDQASRDRRERRLRFAATLISDAFAADYKIGLALAGPGGARAIAPAPGLGQRGKLLDALAGVADGGAHSTDSVLGSLRAQQLRWAQVVVVVDDAASLSARAWQPLRQACRSMTVLDSPELERVFQDAATFQPGRGPVCR